MDKDLTNIPISKAILILSIPLMVTNLILTLYPIVDAYWIGKLGAEAVAGVSLSFPLIFIVNSILMGFTSATATLVATHKGKQNYHEVNYHTTQSLSALTIFGLIIGIIGFLISGQIISALGAEQIVTNYATEYLQIIMLGNVFVAGGLTISATLRGVGEVKILTILSLAGLILNFIFDPIFIFGLFGFPKMGLVGAAWATVLTQGISMILSIWWIQKNKHIIELKKEYLIPHKSTIRKLFKLGAPSSIEFLSRSIGSLILTGIVTGFGTIAIAAFGIGMRVTSFALLPSFGISLAINTLVAQHLGANKNDQIKKIISKGMVFSFIFLIIVSLPLLIFPIELSSFFIDNNKEVIIQSASLIQLFALSLGFIGAQVVILSSYRACGKTKIAMYFALLSIILQVTIALILSKIIGLTGVWAAFPLSSILMLILSYLYYKANPITKSHI